MSIQSPTRVAGRPARWRSALSVFLSDCRGEVAIEYGLIACLVVVALLSGLSQFSGATTKLYNKITNAIGTIP